MNFLPPLSAQAKHARKIYTRSMSKQDVSVLFRTDYNTDALARFVTPYGAVLASTYRDRTIFCRFIDKNKRLEPLNLLFLSSTRLKNSLCQCHGRMFNTPY